MHASASPFEAYAERNNWLGAAARVDPFGKKMLAAGLSESMVMAWSVDPQVVIGAGERGSIFDRLEDL